MTTHIRISQLSSQCSTSLRYTAPNDGRYSRNQRTRHYNNSISSLLILPSSTARSNCVNVDRMESGYHYTAQSINNFAYQQLIRRRVDIMSDLLKNVERYANLKRNGVDEEVILNEVAL